jgi:hypothetical protein
MKIVATRKAEQNRAVIDPWTAVHFAAGLAAGLMELPLKVVLPLATAYELVEHWVEDEEFGQDLFETQGPEKVPNSIFDLAIFAVGHELGRRWNRS